MNKRMIATAAVAATLATVALASSGAKAVAASATAADTCAKGLPADSRMIYDASVRNMKSIETLRDTVVAETKALVTAGKLAEASARPAAEAAGTCLKLLAKS